MAMLAQVEEFAEEVKVEVQQSETITAEPTPAHQNDAFDTIEAAAPASYKQIFSRHHAIVGKVPMSKS